MKLYYSPGASSLFPHLVLRELGLPFELVRMVAKTHTLEDGTDYYGINPKGSVPALRLADGQVLTECTVIAQYLADQRPEAGLVPPAGTMERYRVQEWLNFIATDVHKQASPLFNPKLNDEARAALKDRLSQRLAFADARLAAAPWLMGDKPCVADFYLWVVLTWMKRVEVDLTRFPALLAFMKRVKARPAVQAALQAEGLTPA